jgi:hypothetical protein
MRPRSAPTRNFGSVGSSYSRDFRSDIGVGTSSHEAIYQAGYSNIQPNVRVRLLRYKNSMDGCVDDQDYNDGAQNDHPIGKLNARYRCPFTKPFHGYPPIFKQRLTKGETRRKVRGRGLAMALAVLRLMTSTNLVLACFSGHLGGCLDFWPSTVRTKSLPSFVSATLRLRLHAPS